MKNQQHTFASTCHLHTSQTAPRRDLFPKSSHRHIFLNFYRTRVRSLGMLVTNSLTDSLTDSCLVDLLAVNDTNCLMMFGRDFEVNAFRDSDIVI